MKSPPGRILSALALGILIGCGRSADRSVLESTPYECSAGSLISCRGADGCSGTQLCGEAPELVSSCDCGSSNSSGAGPDAGQVPAGELSPLGQGGSTALDSDRMFCVPGSSRECFGAARCSGLERCDASGAGYGPCECASSVSAGLVAARCRADSDCAAGLTCELSSSPGAAFAIGGPPGGYCTAPCMLDAECVALDPLAACYAPGGVGPGPGYCLETCSLDVGAGVKQCAGRPELACVAPASGDPSFCYPVCASDADCAPGSCDLFSGLCVSTPFAGEKPIGGPCADDFECGSGWCVSIGDQRRACSGVCIYGNVAGCGYPASSALRVAGCLTPRAPDVPSDLPQLGWCSELCDRDADCILSSSGWFCREWPKAEAATASGKWGRRGQCVQPTQGICTDDCDFALDDYCDDGGPDSTEPSLSLCELGSDCTDCGPR